MSERIHRSCQVSTICPKCGKKYRGKVFNKCPCGHYFRTDFMFAGIVADTKERLRKDTLETTARQNNKKSQWAIK